MLILVAGVSGVGKSTLSRAFVEARKNFSYLNAGEVIRGLPGYQMAASKDFNLEQLELADYIRRIYVETTHVLLDGHFVLETQFRAREVPLEAVKKIAPDSILFLRHDEFLIAERRIKMKKLHQSLASPVYIAQIQNREAELSRYYAAQLSIPHYECVARKADFEAAIRRLVRSCSHWSAN